MTVNAHRPGYVALKIRAKSGDGLVNQTTDAFPRVLFPVKAPAEYDVEMDVERKEGFRSLILGLVSGESHFAVHIDGWTGTVSGLDLLDGKGADDNETTTRDVSHLPLDKKARVVASVRREWLNVARTLEVSPVRKAFAVILPAAAPTIMTGMRISIGIAWLVIVAAEMLVGGTGIGYFVWNEWNNLSITNILTAILAIGLIGMILDQILARLTRLVTFPE